MTDWQPNDFYNPYQMPASWPTHEQLDTVPSAGHFWVKTCVCLKLLAVVVGLGLTFWEIKTIIGSGPVLFLVGWITAFLSFRRRLPWGVTFGVSGPLFSLLIFSLINLLDWGPGDAEQPVRILAGVYLGCIGVMAAVLVFQIRARENGFDGT